MTKQADFLASARRTIQLEAEAVQELGKPSGR